MTIMLLEDETELAEMYAQALSDLDHQVHLAGDAQAALNILHKQAVELVLLDLMLPTHNGFAFLYEMRSYEDWQSIPVIILSNFSPRDLPVSQHFLRNLGVADFLIKSRLKPANVVAAVDGLQ